MLTLRNSSPTDKKEYDLRTILVSIVVTDIIESKPKKCLTRVHQFKNLNCNIVETIHTVENLVIL